MQLDERSSAAPIAQGFVFGYGSLAAVGASRPARRRRGGAFVADLRGFRRAWGVAMDNRIDLPGYKYYLDERGRRPEVSVAFLDIAPDAGARVNGLCLPVTAGDLERLDRRERNYERLDVSDLVDAGGAPVWAYVRRAAARERLHRARRAGTAVIDAGYLASVRRAFAALGDAEWRACAPSLAAGGLPVVALRRMELP